MVVQGEEGKRSNGGKPLKLKSSLVASSSISHRSTRSSHVLSFSQAKAPSFSARERSVAGSEQAPGANEV